MRPWKWLLLVALACSAQKFESPSPAPAPTAAAPAPVSAPAAQPGSASRTELNLLAKTEVSDGESRRNENVQFNLIDNNALKELNIRLGTTATIVSEFRADRGWFGAEFGNKPAAGIHLTAGKFAGWHGSVFESHGNSIFNARSFFQAGGVRPAHDNDYGFSLGGRLWRGSSLVIDGSQSRLRGQVNGNVLVPRGDERTPRVTDPTKRALIQRLIDGFPSELPNRTDVNERALNTNSPQWVDDDLAGVRLDHRFNTRDSLLLRYNFTAQQVKAFQFVAGMNPDTTIRAHTVVTTWQRNWSAATVTTSSASFDRVGSQLVPAAGNPGPTVNFTNVLARIGPSSSIPLNRAQNRFRYGAAIRQTRGNHDWYAGYDLARKQVNGAEVSSHRGNLHFRADFGRSVMENFLLGIPSRFSGANGEVHRGFRLWESVAHAGSNYRVNGRLTLNYGVRYEMATSPSEADGLTKIPYPCDCNNLAPRAGLAYRLPGRAGSIRANYGTHFGEIFAVTYSQMRYNPPLVRKFEVLAPDLLLPFQQLNVPVDPNARGTVYDISPNLKTPYSHQYNFSWEAPLGKRMRFQLGYAGSRAHKLFVLWYTNRAVPVAGIPLTTATVNERRPDQTKFDVRRIVNGSRAYYDAARASLIVPRWHGLALEAGYWFSKSIDWGAAYSNTATGEDGQQSQSQTEKDAREDMKGLSVFDQPHAFLARASYSTPRVAMANRWITRAIGRWEISSVVLLKTGTPFSVLTGSDGPGFGNVDGDNGDRPNLLDPSVLGRSISDPDTSRQRLPASAFEFIQPGERRGNLGANTFRKGGIRNVNAAISRSFPFHGDRRLDLRAESINGFNTPQFAAPVSELTNPGFGIINNTLNDGRAFRFTLRFVF